LLSDLRKEDPALAEKIYLLEDCTSPVVVPGADYTVQADQAFARFAEAGMHLVKSADDFLGS
jgi:nicotinamidase-related amidase